MATRSKQPHLYLHIRDSIHRRYTQGEFKPGDRFYSIEEIKKLYNVSAITAVKALDELKRTGLVRSVQGKGSFFQGVADSVDTLGDHGQRKSPFSRPLCRRIPGTLQTCGPVAKGR